MFLDPYTPFCLLSLLLSLPLFPCLPQPSTVAIMTHLPVKLLPVETARPWHRTQCLSASLLKSLKSQVDIILPATGITPFYNASIFSRSLELRAAKQWAQSRSSKSLEAALRNKFGPGVDLFLAWVKCSYRRLGILWEEKLFGQICYCDTRSNYPHATFRQTHSSPHYGCGTMQGMLLLKHSF